MSETKHATYGPSSLKLRRICPGWRNDNTRDQTAADEGTLMHTAYETGDLSKLDVEQRACVEKALKFTASLERGADEVHKEVRLNILGGLTFGTADRVLVYKKVRRAVMVDLKNGRVAVDDAEFNLQGWAYVIGIFDQFDVDEVEAIFVSPRRDEVTRHTFKRSDYTRLATEIRRIIERCQAFDASIDEKNRTCDASLLNAHDDACCYCGFIAKCPKHANYGIEIAKKYAPLEIVDDVHSSELTDPTRMARLFTVARIIERWAESVKKHATDMAKQGMEIPGFELRERAGTREITNPVLAYNVLVESGLEPIEIVSAAKLSLSKIEKLVSDKAPRGQKSKSVATLNAALAANDAINSGESIHYLQKTRE